MDESPGTGALRVVVVDDHTFYRDGLVGLLEESGLVVVAVPDAVDLQPVQSGLAHPPHADALGGRRSAVVVPWIGCWRAKVARGGTGGLFHL